VTGSLEGDHQQSYVLVVEDDVDLRESVELLLSMNGHKVTAVGGGSEALRWLQSGRPHPCLVLLDLMMPGMDGFELRLRMTSDPSLATIPVVVMTGAGVLADQRSGELKAEVLRKPVTRSTLLDTVKRFCVPAPGPA
jgi:CheY-like chemotaxis protein